jgi:hypothetical protein
MASTEDDASDAAANAVPRRRRRPTPTIDLTATEVARKPEEKATAPAQASVAASAGARTRPEPAAASSEPPPTTSPDIDIFSAEAAADSPGGEPPRADSGFTRPDWLPREIPWPPSWPVAGAVGGGIVLVVFALLWLAGLFSPRDDGSNALNARLAQVESRLRQIPNGPAPTAVDPKKLDDLAARVSKLETLPAPPASDAAIASRFAAVETAVKAFQGKLAELDRRADDNAAALREARGRADAAMLAADAARSAPADRGEIEALTKRIAALEQTTKTVGDDLAKRAAAAGDRPVRLAVSAQALRAAVERGDPFAAELAAVRPLAADPQTLAPLEPFAASGVPTQAALARQLPELVAAMQRLAGAPPPEAGVFDRLRASAERLVRIRPMEEGPGDDPTTIIARIEAKAARSDIAGALAELAKLPAPVRAPAEDWIKRAEARSVAVDASRRFAGNALAALGKPSP